MPRNLSTNRSLDQGVSGTSGDSLVGARATIGDFAQRLIQDVREMVSAGEIALLRQQLAAMDARCADPDCPLPPDPTTPTIVRDETALAGLAPIVAGADALVVDLETSGLDPRKGDIIGIGIAVAGATYYIPINHRGEEDHQLRAGQLPLARALDALRLGEKRIIADNAKFELKWLRRHGGITPVVAWDTMLAARLMRSDLPAGLKALAMRELDVPDWSLPKADLARIEFLSIETVAAYCARDCWYTHLLYLKQRDACP
jgi:hypothetical protein